MTSVLYTCIILYIRCVSVFSNDLIELSKQPLGLPELQILELAHNDIDTLPDDFLSVCCKLESLDLSYNRLSEFDYFIYFIKL